jgi:hypothetical protein
LPSLRPRVGSADEAAIAQALAAVPEITARVAAYCGPGNRPQ